MHKKKFTDQFAIDDDVHGTGSFVYTADACAKRFIGITSLDIENTKLENSRIAGHNDRVYPFDFREIDIAVDFKRLQQKYPNMLKDNPLVPLEEIIEVYLDMERREV